MIKNKKQLKITNLDMLAIIYFMIQILFIILNYGFGLNLSFILLFLPTILYMFTIVTIMIILVLWVLFRGNK